MPTIAAFSYRHSAGPALRLPGQRPQLRRQLPVDGVKIAEVKYKPNPVLERALDTLFILHADHEQNCSTSAMRQVGSSHVDPYSAVAAGDRGALRPAARRRQRGGAAHAEARSARPRTSPSSSRR